MKNAMQLKAIMKKLAKENQISAQLVLQNYILGVSVRDAFCIERKEKPLAPKTIREYVLFANQVLHFANERYHSVQAEFKKPEKGTRPRFVDCIHEDEVKKLMAEISKYPIQEQVIVLSLLNTGVRRAELAGLTWSDFNFRDCTVHVNKSLLDFQRLWVSAHNHQGKQ